jgi:phage terminase small subunit
MNPKSPRGLSRKAKGIWKSVVEGWQMDAHSLALLQVACEAWDDIEAARAEIKKSGLIVKAPSGQRRKNPAVEALKAARDSFLRSWTALSLDAEPPGPIGRPSDRH